MTKFRLWGAYLTIALGSPWLALLYTPTPQGNGPRSSARDVAERPAPGMADQSPPSPEPPGAAPTGTRRAQSAETALQLTESAGIAVQTPKEQERGVALHRSVFMDQESRYATEAIDPEWSAETETAGA